VIVTFYSYKGGVGRSMALANVAAWLRLQGLQVVMIDWDLEAPGLESFFAADLAERTMLRAKIGLVDLISMYKDVFPSLPKPVPAAAGSSPAGSDLLAQFVATLDEMLPPIAHTLIPIRIESAGTGTGKLSLLSAGCRDETRFNNYAQTVQQFDWENFYASYHGEAYFEWMRRQLLRPGIADIVLIDSRTGVAEMSGVCTRQLADVVVMLCAPNEQNLEGTGAMAKSFTRPDVLEARRGRVLDLLPVPARVDVSEGRPVDLFEERFRDTLEPFIPVLLRRLPAPRNPLRIPYIREYAYTEQLAIGDAAGVKTLQQAYVTLAAHLVALAAADSATKRQCRGALQETFGLPTILVASLDPADPDFAAGVRARLDAAGVMAVHTSDKPEAALETAGSARRSATPYGAVVLAIKSYSRADTRIRDLWRRSRGFGITLALAVERGESDANEIPRWPRRVQVYDIAKHFNELVQSLQAPIQLAPIPFMAPPVRPGFVGRTREIDEIKQMLGVTPIGAAARRGSAAQSRSVAIVGLAGIGKSALARAVCHDDDVIDNFDDGIVWMTLGNQPDLLNAATGVLAAFGEDVSGITHIEEAERRLASRLTNKQCLVVVDDVIDVAHLNLIPSIGPAARVIVTTRSLGVAGLAADATFALDPLAASDAVTWMTRQKMAPEIAEQLAEKLGNLPLALELADQILRRGVPAQYLIERLDDEGLTAIDGGSSGDTSVSLFASFMSALEQLPPDDRLRLPMLASLPPLERINLSTFADRCGIGLWEAAAMARRVAAMSLIACDFDGIDTTITISAPVHAFLRSLQLRQNRAEAIRRSRPETGEGIIGISYRRDDAAYYASRLYDRLSERFGFDRVFMEDAIRPGEDFVRAIERRMDKAAAWLVVIGPNWTESANSRGERRLDDPEDFVRIEIAAALERGIRVIPVLVAGAVMPRSEELPGELRGLARRNAIRLDERGFEQGVDGLISALDRLSAPSFTEATITPAAPVPPAVSEPARPKARALAETRRRRRRLLISAIGIAATLVLGALIGMWFRATTIPRDAANSAVTEAIFQSAEDSFFGRGVPQDYQKALLFYQAAAKSGYAPALNALGRMYEDGIGVPKDLARAVEYYKLAASNGNDAAKAALARLQAKQ
jgi:NB-ARC domain/TIR domain/Sel1 repeat/CobQ/CobB/MinD/ParA nucleotide binding domain